MNGKVKYGNTKHYVIMGDPIALARARYGRGKFYDSQKNTKLVWGIHLKNQHDTEFMFSGPLLMDVIFYMPIPATYTQKKKGITLNQWHFLRPDSSNLVKFIEDVATTICYKDDCIIVKHIIEKAYDDGQGPRTEFILSELREKREPRNLKGLYGL